MAVYLFNLIIPFLIFRQKLQDRKLYICGQKQTYKNGLDDIVAITITSMVIDFMKLV